MGHYTTKTIRMTIKIIIIWFNTTTLYKIF